MDKSYIDWAQEDGLDLFIRRMKEVDDTTKLLNADCSC